MATPTSAATGVTLSTIGFGMGNYKDETMEQQAKAAFADVLRGGTDAEHWSLDKVKEVAQAAAGEDAHRKELIALITKAIAIKDRTASRQTEYRRRAWVPAPRLLS